VSKVQLQPDAFRLADSGYKVFKNSTPIPNCRIRNVEDGSWSFTKSSTTKLLTKLRLSIEHVNAKLRVYRILKEHYRCRRSRFGLRFNLIAGLYNFELVLSS